MTRPIRLLLILLIAAALMGASPAWAAAPTCCLPAAHAAIPAKSPCVDFMPGCAGMISCQACAALPAMVDTSDSLVGKTQAAYWLIPASLEGLPIEPALDPPIAI